MRLQWKRGNRILPNPETETNVGTRSGVPNKKQKLKNTGGNLGAQTHLRPLQLTAADCCSVACRSWQDADTRKSPDPAPAAVPMPWALARDSTSRVRHFLSAARAWRCSVYIRTHASTLMTRFYGSCHDDRSVPCGVSNSARGSTGERVLPFRPLWVAPRWGRPPAL